jgi:hypothetical protein
VNASMRPPPPLLLLLLLQCVLGTMASAAVSSPTPEKDERAAKKIFVELGAHESSPWTWHVAMDELKPTRWEDPINGRAGWRVRIRWWKDARWPHNADRVVRNAAAQTRQFNFETEEVARWGDQLTDQQLRDRRAAGRQQRTTRQQVAQAAVQRQANDERKAQVAAAAAAKRKQALADAAHRRANGKAKRRRQARGLIAAASIDDARTPRTHARTHTTHARTPRTHTTHARTHAHHARTHARTTRRGANSQSQYTREIKERL